MSFTFSIFKKSTPTEIDILNFGLKISLLGGEEFMQPIQNLLSNKFSFLSSEKLDEYDNMCRSARDFGYDFVYKNIGDIKPHDMISKSEFKRKYLRTMIQNFSWIDKANLRRVFNLGKLWAYHDGLI